MLDTNPTDSDQLLELIYQVLQSKFGTGHQQDDIRDKQTNEKYDVATLKNNYINQIMSLQNQIPSPPKSLPSVFRKVQ
jgi:hypothetical protein